MTASAFPRNRWKAPQAGASRWLGGAQFVVIATTGALLALWLQPQPHSDWLYYWDAAGTAAHYQRGGIGLALLAMLKAAGLSPPAAALAINLPSAAALLAMAYRLDGSDRKFVAHLVAGYLWLISPFFGIVQLDLLATALLGAAFWLLLDADIRVRGRTRATIGSMLGAAAVSTKPQLALILWAMLALFATLRWPLRKRWPRSADVLLSTLLCASLMGFASDYAVRAAVGQRDSMRTTSAVTLYGGLLVSGTRKGCGYWSSAAAEAARQDLDKPLSEAIADRLAAKPLSHWVRVMACKIPQIMLPPPFAGYWLIESPNVRTALEASPHRSRWERAYARAQWIERKLYRALVLVIVASALATGIRLFRYAPFPALLGPVWITAFWGVHAVFEIQGRYFMPMLALAPLLLAVAVRARRQETVTALSP